MNLRPERVADFAAIRATLVAAFPTDAEARVVDRLRASGNATLGLVAEAEGAVVGHVLFSPVIVDGAPRRHGLGLAPLAVSPRQQKRGIGSLLIAAGIDACRGKTPFVVVLGEPGYYGRFGFTTAGDVGLRNEYGATDEFMVLELRQRGLPPAGGLVRYGSEFAEFASEPDADA